MLGLQLLLTQSAALATSTDDVARKHAADLARRAMSGPEMNAMHHGGAHMPMMKATHDLGDAVFELLEAASQEGPKDRLLQIQLQTAAQAAQMRLTGKLLIGEAGAFMQEQGKILTALPSPAAGNSAYDKAAAHLLKLLAKTSLDQNKHHTDSE